MHTRPPSTELELVLELGLGLININDKSHLW